VYLGSKLSGGRHNVITLRQIERLKAIGIPILKD